MRSDSSIGYMSSQNSRDWHVRFFTESNRIPGNGGCHGAQREYCVVPLAGYPVMKTGQFSRVASYNVMLLMITSARSRDIGPRKSRVRACWQIGLSSRVPTIELPREGQLCKFCLSFSDFNRGRTAMKNAPMMKKAVGMCLSTYRLCFIQLRCRIKPLSHINS